MNALISHIPEIAKPNIGGKNKRNSYCHQIGKPKPVNLDNFILLIHLSYLFNTRLIFLAAFLKNRRKTMDAPVQAFFIPETGGIIR